MTGPRRDTTVEPEGVEPVPCDAFHQTLLLLDGDLDGSARQAAQAHATACSICGPLVAGWARTAAVVVAHLEDAAERAKPELVGVADHVFARIDADALEPEEEPEHRGLRRFLLQLKPWLVLGTAAAAIGLSVGPLLMEGGAGESGIAIGAGEASGVIASTSPSEQGADGARLSAEGAGAGDDTTLADTTLADETPTDCIVRKLSFDGADGMVYRTEADGMTVIWINEHEEA